MASVVSRKLVSVAAGCFLAMVAVCLVFSSRAAEYEVDGKIKQTIAFNGTNRYASASFTIYVRDCGWLLKSDETDELGQFASKEMGSTNGTEIYSCTLPVDQGGSWSTAMVESNVVPVGWLDSAIVGHLWLMFASQCYWPKLNSDQLKPIYDWHACAGGNNPTFRVSGEWKLLNGPGSLPREVVYFDSQNQTNAVYRVTGTNRVGAMLIPSGFVFDQRRNSKSEKHIEVSVTAVREGCSRARLIPSPGSKAIIVDERLIGPNGTPSYRNPVPGEWPTVEEARALAEMSDGGKKRAENKPVEESGHSSETNPVPVLSLAIRCTAPELKAGDEIPIEFRITNRGTNDYKYADRTYDRSGRVYEYRLVAKDETGKAVVDPRTTNQFWINGGLYQNQILKPGESYTKVIPLNRWALVKDAGRYVVTGSYSAGESYSTNIVIEAEPVTITVLPRTPDEMGKYIAGLAAQVDAHLSGKPNDKWSRAPDPDLNQAVMKLMYTCDSRIVPSLLKSLCDSNSGGGFWESEALRFYVPHTEKTRKAIMATASQRGLGANGVMALLLKDYGCTAEELKPMIARALAPEHEEDWAAGAQLAKQLGDDSFTERLIAIAKTPRNRARTAAIDALAFNRTDAGVKALKDLLNDPHREIWTPLVFAIQNAYGSRGGATGRPLRPDDFMADDMKPLVARLFSSENQAADASTAIGILRRFGGDEFMPRLIAIAKEPDNFARPSAIYALAMNRTDEGVQLLKALLKDGDSNIRVNAEAAIREAYNNRGNSRGRPLRPEDFDESYQRR